MEEKIKAYAKLMEEYGLTALEVTADGSLRLERQPAPVMPMADLPLASSAAPAAPAPVDDGLTEITSPMIGVFYAGPDQQSAPFVKKGDRIKKGQTLGIIEAMKLMNEITAEEDCLLEDVCVKNGQVVEFGTVLFKVRG